MNSKIRSDALDKMFSAILTLESVDECYDFFDDLCTVPELKALSQRFQVAEMLLNKKVYSDIVKTTGASTATISRVNRSLSFGNDGYKNVLTKKHEK
ncbi:MAG: YerC/YecD family TrpR-related protein [Oscillospiraceae bacterium]